MRLVVTCALALAAMGCGGAGPSVTRVVDGRVVEGRFVSPLSYELFLRGAIAEDTGDLGNAIAGYDAAARSDPTDAFLWTKVAEARCAKNVHDARISDALDRALSLDPEFGPALALRVKCGGGGPDEARRAMSAEPRDARLTASMQRFLSDARDDGGARERLLALVLARPEPAAYRALFAWAEAHDDDALALMAAKGLAAVSTTDGPALSSRAKELAGEGAVSQARAIAAAVVDHASGARVDPAVALLAVDHALAAGELERATRRASLGRVDLVVVAARAMALGNASAASELASLVSAADPANTGARMVLAAAGAESSDLGAIAKALAGATAAAPVDASVAIVFLRALARQTGDADARAFASKLPAFEGADGLLVPLAVDLAARGVIDAASLPAEAQIELDIRRGVAPREPGGPVDARHRLVLAAWLRPKEAASRTLAAKLAARCDRDALVGAAIVHMAQESGEPLDPASERALLAQNPSDPIALATALAALSGSAGGPDALRAKRRLAAIAATPAEQELSRF